MADVAILGAGMAGLLAAHALDRLGIPFHIYDRRQPTLERPVYGLHYLHDPCDLEVGRVTVYNVITGVPAGEDPAEAYARKAGTTTDNSVARLRAYETGYDFRTGMTTLVHRFGDRVVPMEANDTTLEVLLRRYDHVISSVPRHVVYADAVCSRVTVAGDRGVPPYLPPAVDALGENIVVYNLDPDTAWYRFSRVHGRQWHERVSGGQYPIHKVLDTSHVQPEHHRGRVHLIGRYGRWERGYLSHNAYYDTLRTFA